MNQILHMNRFQNEMVCPILVDEKFKIMEENNRACPFSKFSET